MNRMEQQGPSSLAIGADTVKRNSAVDQRQHQVNDFPAFLTWKDISAHLESPGASKQLLHGVSGIARPGELLAIMGASGAGKTTLLNIIGGQAIMSNLAVNGSVKLNGHSLNLETVHNFVGFVHQEDVFPDLLTVREYLWFHAKLRMVDPKITDQDRKDRVSLLLKELSLTSCADSLVGSPDRGRKTLSGGERKRLSIATELIVDPTILLLDEPTSGLDSFLAETVVLSLRSLAKQAGKTVIFTVHQPSSQLYSYFDRLLLLAEGQVCFHGSTGDAGRFFASPPISQPCPNDFNPADFYMDVICRRLGDKLNVITEAYHSSSLAEMEAAEIQKAASPSKESPSRRKIKKASIMTQLGVGIWRAAKVYYRSPIWIRARFIETLTYPLLFGLCFLGLGLDPVGVANRCGLLIQITGDNAWANLNQYTSNLPGEHYFLLRECSAGLYEPWVYFASRQTIELPFIFIMSLLSTTIIYVLPLMFTTTGFTGYLIAVATGYVVALAASSIGYFFGFMTENFNVVVSVCYPVLNMLYLLNGFWINFASIPPYLQWASYLSVFFLGNENVYIGEWANVTLPDCSQFDDSSVRCFDNGAEVLDFYNYDISHLGRNFGLLLAIVAAVRLAALAILTYRVKRATTPKTYRYSCFG